MNKGELDHEWKCGCGTIWQNLWTPYDENHLKLTAIILLNLRLVTAHLHLSPWHQMLIGHSTICIKPQFSYYRTSENQSLLFNWSWHGKISQFAISIREICINNQIQEKDAHYCHKQLILSWHFRLFDIRIRKRRYK